MERRVLRAASAGLLAVAVAGAAVLALRPRDDLATVPRDEVPRATSYFSAAQLDRAADFRGPQRWLGMGRLAVEAGVLVLLVARPPRRLTAAGGRPVLRGAAAGAAIAVAVTAATLPVSAVMRERAKDVGLVTQSWTGWAADVVRATAIEAGLTAVAVAVALALMRRLPRGWWVGAAAGVWLLGAGAVVAAPVVIDPLFNDFREVPPGQLRDDVVDLARRAGVDVGEVLVMDASRRTSGANAYVAGLGATKRVVLYDTLVDRYPRAELRSVVAHELAHVANRDLRGGLLFLALVAPAGMWAVAVALRGRPAGPPAVAPLLLGVLVIGTAITWTSNDLSRRVEARADADALRLTGQPDAFIAFKRRLTLQNVGDPDPPRAWHGLLGTHPTTMERIAIAERVRERRGPG